MLHMIKTFLTTILIWLIAGVIFDNLIAGKPYDYRQHFFWLLLGVFMFLSRLFFIKKIKPLLKK